MSRIIMIISMLLCMGAAARAQYVTSGKIEYERRINVHAKMKDNMDDENNSWYQQQLADAPKFNLAYFDMTFNRGKSLYKPGRAVESKAKFNDNEPAEDNVVLTDFTAKQVKAVKHVFEQKFLEQDTMRKIDWRIKSELRTIAGYKCRKAVGIICDSVYVVAFFAEDIAANGGPELFCNLPGMILELAIPRLHTTWTATKVELAATTDADFVVPEKGKKVNAKELYETIQTSLKDWGKWGTRYIWLTVI